MYPEERDIDARLQDLGRRLLMNISEDGVISMHDAVVDMALSIMKKAEISPATYRIFIEGWRGQTQPLSLNLVRCCCAFVCITPVSFFGPSGRLCGCPIFMQPLATFFWVSKGCRTIAA